MCHGLILAAFFLDKKSDFQIANFQLFSIFAKNADFSKSSQGYFFELDGCAFKF